jgi:dTDP-4-dehydrorhamnose 3,5-epimerase
MNIIKTDIDGVLILEPRIFHDERGYFLESFSEKWFRENVCDTYFVQDNESKSRYGVLRGLHFQKPPFEQAKLIRVVLGKVLDIAVDIRESSPTFGQYVSVELSDENKRQLFIPRGFAHGFVVLSDEAVFQYKCDNYYTPDYEGNILWNDATLNIDWKIPLEDIILSKKDKK